MSLNSSNGFPVLVMFVKITLSYSTVKLALVFDPVRILDSGMKSS